jgi:hypothetical protein
MFLIGRPFGSLWPASAASATGPGEFVTPGTSGVRGKLAAARSRDRARPWRERALLSLTRTFPFTPRTAAAAAVGIRGDDVFGCIWNLHVSGYRVLVDGRPAQPDTPWCAGTARQIARPL